MQFFKGIDPPDGPLGQYLRADYSLEDVIEFDTEQAAVKKAKYIGEEYDYYCYVLTVKSVNEE